MTKLPLSRPSIFALARADSITPEEAAEKVAERRMRDVGRLRGVYLRGD